MKQNPLRYTRLKALFGKQNFEKLQQANILLIGVGGVGSFCLDSLYRSGVVSITIVDFDIYDISNQNRQIGSERIGESKVKVLQELYQGIDIIETEVTPLWISDFDFDNFDLIIDAIDNIPVKVALAQAVSHKLISSCGGARRFDPTALQIDSIWKTNVDPFARKFRYELRQSGFNKDFSVVYSSEVPAKIAELGSFVAVTASLGLALSALAIRKIL